MRSLGQVACGLGREESGSRGKRIVLGGSLGLGQIWVELSVGLGVLGFLMGFYFSFLFYSISKTNKQSLNSNTTLNSDHTQIIKTMHQHECDTKKKLNL